MRVSLNWLKDFVELPSSLSPKEIANDLTSKTVEVEEVIDLAENFTDMVVGEILAIKAHPNADKLKICSVAVGLDEPKEIVCGGSNLRKGMKVVVAKPGAKVRWHGEGEPVELKETKIRGVTSFGMICAANEVGLEDLYPMQDEHEIIDLGDLDKPAGMAITEALGINDVIFNIDNKSLTNRPDLWGHYGIALELSAIYDAPFKPINPVRALPENNDCRISLNAGDVPRRFSAIYATDVTNGEAPDLIRKRLMVIGQRPINLFADITNYIMFAVGEPTHVFDADKVEGKELRVRFAKKGEELLLLNGGKILFETSDEYVVVADQKKPLSLAGIIGGEDSGVTDETRNILFESAVWDPSYIRRASRKLNIRTESSLRFDKGIDTYRVDLAKSMFLDILERWDIPLGSIALVGDQHPLPTARNKIKINKTFICSRLGMEISDNFIDSTLKKLRFDVQKQGDTFEVIAPSWRSTGDISIQEDIVEEIGRMIGYDNIPIKPLKIELLKPVIQPQVIMEDRIGEFLTLSGGMFEVYSYPWSSEQLLRACGYAEETLLEMADPPSPENRFLKPSLIPNLLHIAERNYRTEGIMPEDVRIFEVGWIFLNKQGEKYSIEEEDLPLQIKQCGGLIIGNDKTMVFREICGLALDSLSYANAVGIYPKISKEQKNFPWIHGRANVSIYAGKEMIGTAGLVSGRILRALGIKDRFVGAFEFRLDRLTAMVIDNRKIAPIPKHPGIFYDLAVVFDENVAWQEISKIVYKACPQIRNVVFIEDYRGKNIPAGKKSVAFRMELRDDNSTLTAEMADNIAKNVLAILFEKLGGELRTS
ncbi:MAG: phenylalanine--tRNA ligase subunit beta [Candidatus Dadabacteria bacterium]|nr:MAG: phenylalanine--tRNA ligase subunit beta [Candidatus Dadabacteria bacterium]